jgi:hypothetical protein
LTEYQLTAGAIEHLKVLSQKQGISTPTTQDLQCLWDQKFIMGSHARTHITAQGKKFILRLMEHEKGPREGGPLHEEISSAG